MPTFPLFRTPPKIPPKITPQATDLTALLDPLSGEPAGPVSEKVEGGGNFPGKVPGGIVLFAPLVIMVHQPPRIASV